MTELVRQGEVPLVPTMGVLFGQREAVRRFVVGHSESGHHHVLECDTEFELITTGNDLMIALYSAASCSRGFMESRRDAKRQRCRAGRRCPPQPEYFMDNAYLSMK
jgi:hypothetical protein